MKKKPSKPTKPFGTINFSSSGKVKKVMHQLSPEKEKQELEAFYRFISKFNKKYAPESLHMVEQLDENGHDFLASINGAKIEIQLTEIVSRDWLIEIDKKEYNSGKYNYYSHRIDSDIPYAIDMMKKINALKKAISKKHEKFYAKCSHPLWLIVFTTDTSYLTEYWEDTEKTIPRSLILARQYCSTLQNDLTFNQIWFTNLLTNPVRVF